METRPRDYSNIGFAYADSENRPTKNMGLAVHTKYEDNQWKVVGYEVAEFNSKSHKFSSTSFLIGYVCYAVGFLALLAIIGALIVFR